MTTATELLLAAYGMAMASDEELHKKWISVSFALGARAGNVHIIAAQRIGRLDMLLRLLEGERLKRMEGGPPKEPDFSLDVQSALSESWLLSAYEVVRAAKEQLKRRGEERPNLLVLEHRLAIVRMPIAKGEIQGMNQKANRENPPMLVKAGDDTPEAYQDDGSYILPRGLCGEVGAVVWYPVDMMTRETIAICRRDLSDEMLALFD
ncbi:hypothetical protein [Pedomonas mirosovicensis]|uniref:hypothetical protein n=1 Tax=Pedomonas mirosovicensis TaxID=2908641 RepID=UPI002167F730|nr:hypothetical protein [Pedomonas mirosovicensis]MCH8685875.1 hypothetical protein [Pedomonas mirosovicensis]